MQGQDSQSLLKQTHEDLKSIAPRIDEAESLLSTLEAAGEEVGEQRKKLRELKTRKSRWDQTLAARLK